MSGFKRAVNPFPAGVQEEWRLYPKTNLLVSNAGRVRTARHDYCSVSVSRWGYEQVWGQSVHRMVAELFVVGRDDERNVVNHLDANKRNNRFNNLEWTDRVGNARHAREFGRYEATTGDNHWTRKDPSRRKFGERNGRAKLTEEQVKEIRTSSESGPVLAKKFGVTRTIISEIRRRISWRHV